MEYNIADKTFLSPFNHQNLDNVELGVNHKNTRNQPTFMVIEGAGLVI